MKTLLYLFLLTIIACADPTQKDKSSANSIEPIPEPDKKESESTVSAQKPNNCSASDFLKLKDKNLQDDFFRQLDSLRKSQYRINDPDTKSSVDITQNLLKKFLKEVNIDTLQKNGTYECFYFFNIAPPEFVDSKKCKDKITIQYLSETCEFRMMVDNVYLVDVEDDKPYCIGGAQVVYDFKILDGKIVDFRRGLIG